MNKPFRILPPLALLLAGFCATQLPAQSLQVIQEATTNTMGLSQLAFAFDGKLAMDLVQEQVDAGPRIPGTPGHAATRDLIKRELTRWGWQVEEVELGPVTPTLTGKSVPIHNIIGRWEPQRARKISFAAHYDTRPVSDQATRPQDVMKPVPGANDGGSGVAIMLEMARAIAARPPKNVGVLLIFHDVEDQGIMRGQTSTHPYKEFALGAEAQAGALSPADHMEAGLNLDMVGDANLLLFREAYSLEAAPALVEEVWVLGEEFFPEVFSRLRFVRVIDDHLPYLERGLPVIDLIDFNYTPWHTPGDTVDALSEASLEAVGRISLEFLARRDGLATP